MHEIFLAVSYSADFILETYYVKYKVRINYRRISLSRNLSRKCRKIVKFLSIAHSERNIWNGPIVATAISRMNTAIENVTQDMLERVWREWEYRLDICRVTRGAHIECI